MFQPLIANALVTAMTYCFDAMSCSVLCGEDEGSLMS